MRPGALRLPCRDPADGDPAPGSLLMCHNVNSFRNEFPGIITPGTPPSRLHEQPNRARVGRAVRATTRPLRPTRSAGRIRNAIEDTVSSAASALKYPADVDSFQQLWR